MDMQHRPGSQPDSLHDSRDDYEPPHASFGPNPTQSLAPIFNPVPRRLKNPATPSPVCLPPSPSPLSTPAATGPVSEPNAQAVFGHLTDPRAATGPAATPTAAADAQAKTDVQATAEPNATPVPAGAKEAMSLANQDSAIDAAIETNRCTRSLLDEQKKSDTEAAGATEKQLNSDRRQLLSLLNERNRSIDESIQEIDTKLGNKTPKNPTPEEQELLERRAQLVKDKAKYKNQHTTLSRWENRNEINEINQKLKDPELDPAEKTRLGEKKKQLAESMLSTTTEYEQWDSKWGNTVYGKDKSYTTMREAGCGPTSLAMLLDAKDQEDPEGNFAAGDQHKKINPRTVADYSTHHGRVKGSGTSGDVMMNDLEKGFPGKKGRKLKNLEEVRAALRDGKPVLFLGHNMGGTKNNGKAAKAYKGHFMVLNGVSEDGKNFDVLDGGRSDASEIASVSSKQLQSGGAGYWIVE
jgi:hypothetical protein